MISSEDPQTEVLWFSAFRARLTEPQGLNDCLLRNVQAGGAMTNPQVAAAETCKLMPSEGAYWVKNAS
jgi:hypothetical protein